MSVGQPSACPCPLARGWLEIWFRGGGSSKNPKGRILPRGGVFIDKQRIGGRMLERRAGGQNKTFLSWSIAPKNVSLSLSLSLEARVAPEVQRLAAASRSGVWASWRTRRISFAGSSGGVTAWGSNHRSIVPTAERPASFNADQSLRSRWLSHWDARAKSSRWTPASEGR